MINKKNIGRISREWNVICGKHYITFLWMGASR